MLDRHQSTIRNTISFDGIGVHSGAKSLIILKPSPPNSGIIIKNSKAPHQKIVIGKVVPQNRQYATVLQNDDFEVSTVEHVMAALGVLGIDNVEIELEGGEFPILDGSAIPFIKKISQEGHIEKQDAQKELITPKEKLVFSDDQDRRLLQIEPAVLENGEAQKQLHISYSADFAHPKLSGGSIECTVSKDYFLKELAPARTFGVLEQWPLLKQKGIALGSSLENTLVVSNEGFVNERRFADEHLRHKLLDLIGDLALLGKTLVGKVKAVRVGHSFNRLVIDHFIKHPEKWEILP